jgi:hypothetical protein
MLTYAHCKAEERRIRKADKQLLPKHAAGTQFTCFTGTKVQILTLQAPAAVLPAGALLDCLKEFAKVLSLLALLVQKCKY